jgi:hypothetical protein
VKDLKVEKADFDAILKTVIASPPISKAEVTAKIHGWQPRPMRKAANRKQNPPR